MDSCKLICFYLIVNYTVVYRKLVFVAITESLLLIQVSFIAIGTLLFSGKKSTAADV